jgi:integral membrane protein
VAELADRESDETTTTHYRASPEAVRRALTFFKVMAFVVGVGLLLLVTAMVLRYGFERPQLSKAWSPIHGFLYMVYVGATVFLGGKLRWGLGKMVLVMLAGTVPFVSFWAERRVSREVDGTLAAIS